MTFGAHYKGYVSEVTMGHQTGLYLECNGPLTFSASTTAGNDYTEITFAGTGNANTDVGASGILSVPLGMLICCRMTFHGSAGNF